METNSHGKYKHRKTEDRLLNYVRRMPHHLGIKVTNNNWYFELWGRVHQPLIVTKGYHSLNDNDWRYKGTRLQSLFYRSSCVLQGFLRKLRRIRTHKSLQAAPRKQAHQHHLPSIPWTCEERNHPCIPHWYSWPADRHIYQGSISEPLSEKQIEAIGFL